MGTAELSASASRSLLKLHPAGAGLWFHLKAWLGRVPSLAPSYGCWSGISSLSQGLLCGAVRNMEAGFPLRDQWREKENKVKKTEVTIVWYPNFRKDILSLLLEMRLGVYPTQTRELSWGRSTGDGSWGAF